MSIYLSESTLLKRSGWTPEKIGDDLGKPDKIETHDTAPAIHFYELRRIEDVEATWTSQTKQPGQTSKNKRKPRRKRRKPTSGMTAEQQEALTASMFYQAKDGIDDEELLSITWSASALKRRGWTDGLIGDLLGEPDWLLPNPKYPNSAAPMKLWYRERVERLERTDVWQERKSKRPGVEIQTEPGTPIDNLALTGWWHGQEGDLLEDTMWGLLGADMSPRVKASVDSGKPWLLILPPLSGSRIQQWDAEQYADMVRDETVETPYLVPIDDAYETCSGCGCPLPPRDTEVACPSCGVVITTLGLTDDQKAMNAVLIHPPTEERLLSAALGITERFLELHHTRWLESADTEWPHSD